MYLYLYLMYLHVLFIFLTKLEFIVTPLQKYG